MSQKNKRPRPPVTPRQRQAARETLAKLRKRSPDKFNPQKNGARKALEKKKVEPPAPKISTPPPPPQPQPTPTAPPVVTPPPALEIPKPTPPPAPVITPPPQPTPQPTPTAPLIVDESELFSAPPPKPTEEIPGGPPPAPEPQPKTETQTPGGKAANIALAQMVWGMILRIAILIFGDGVKENGEPNPRTARMLPQVIKTPAGDIDENANVLTAFVEYFDSVGFVKLSPLWNLLLTLAGYFLMRLEVIVLWFKSRKARSAQTREPRPTKPEEKSPAEEAPRPRKPAPEEKGPRTPPPPPVVELEDTAETSFSQID